MIGTIFEFNGEVVDIRLNGGNLYFRKTLGGSGGFYPISGLHISKEGAIKEFPDLKTEPNWKDIALQRFKDKLKAFPNENQAMDYIIDDLKCWGYKPLLKQRQGFRPEKLK